MTKRINLHTTPADDAPAEDAEIVLRVLQGDRESFSILVRRYQSGLFHFALGMVGSADTAADIVQDSLIKAFASLDRCREPHRFGAWVHRIVRNRCLDHLKRMRVRRTIDLDGEFRSAEDAESRVLNGELRSSLFAALDSLPGPQREAFLLKHLEDRSYEEMAEMAGASISALKMRVKRAREALQGLLARHA
jgi:RNA polymerase sigma-70 factor, ECF subfamily